MRRITTSVVIAGAALASALAAWLAAGSVHIVSWPDTGPQRIALLPPLRPLALTVVCAATAAAILWFAPPRTAAARGRRAAMAAPSLALLINLLPYLPWLPDRLPVLVALAGPLKWVVFAVVLVVVMTRLPGFAALAQRLSGSLKPRGLFLIALAVYLVFGLRSLTTIGLKGDEPHYLIISQSLLADRDLQIENNHRRREYRRFTREELPPDYLQRGQDGQIYSIHAPGLAAFLLPSYALAGSVGAVLTMCVTGALAAVAVFRLAALTATPTTALITFVAVALTVPFIPYAWSLFPEMAGAAIAAWMALWIADRREVSPAWWFARGFLIATLPWLHTKFVIIEAGLGLTAMWRLRGDRRRLVAFAGPIAMMAALWFTFFYVVYGIPNPEAPYGQQARDAVRLMFVPRGLLGLLFDQKFGLLTYAPVYALALAGVAFVARSGHARSATLPFILTALAFTVSTARFYMWWGGWSAPARFLVPVLPLVVPALASAVDRLRGARLGWVVTVLLAVSLATSLAGAALPSRYLLFSEAHGVSRLAEYIQGSAPLTATLPMFTESEWQLRDLVPRAYSGAERTASVVRGRIDLLERGDRARFAVDLSRWRLLSLEERRRAATLTADIAPAGGTPPVPPSGLYSEGESFWTMGTERALIVIPGGAGTVEVTVHVGPDGGTCRIGVNSVTRAEAMTPNDTRVLTFATPTDASWIPVTVQASRAFRPADVDPNSADQRLLGCQVRLSH